jgi:hypothetical protein
VKLSFFSHSASVSSSLGELCSGAASLAVMVLTSGGLVNPIGNGALFCVRSVPSPRPHNVERHLQRRPRRCSC